ncbi:MAG: hypothetical protein ACRCTD_09135 [Beijerinckiaceae bacterium]
MRQHITAYFFSQMRQKMLSPALTAFTRPHIRQPHGDKKIVINRTDETTQIQMVSWQVTSRPESAPCSVSFGTAESHCSATGTAGPFSTPDYGKKDNIYQYFI